MLDEDGNPLPDVDLLIKCDEDGEEYSAKTDSEGQFLLENVKSGNYSVSVQSSDYHGSATHEVGGEATREGENEGDVGEDTDDTAVEGTQGSSRGQQ